jgi:hypothetical protein
VIARFFATAVHLAPNAPWLWLLLLSAGLVALGVWAYRFAIPPLPALARRALPTLRALSLVALAWLLAQPVLERAVGGGGRRLVVLLDRSLSMELPASPGGAESRGRVAERAAGELVRAWRGRAAVTVVPFAGALGDSDRVERRDATALGDALAALPGAPVGREVDGVVIVSDGVVNAGDDPVAAARGLGVPGHALVVGASAGADRAVTEVQVSTSARVGEATPVRVRVVSSEPRGTVIPVRLLDGGRELARANVTAPGGGAEAVAEFRITPARPGLAVWTASVDSLAGEVTDRNNARQAALEVAPGRLGVLMVSDGLNWDLTFLRRAWLADSGLAVRTLVRDRGAWRRLEAGRAVPPPSPADLRATAVVVLDGVAPAGMPPEFASALVTFVRQGGGLLVLPGPLPGLARLGSGPFGSELAVALDPQAVGRGGQPEPTAEASDLTAWDDDPARGERAWRGAAPLSNLAPVAPGAGDRVIIGSLGGGPPLLLARRVGRGQALLVNGTGLWRWSLAGADDLSAERGRRLWRRLVRWLAEPVQGEPLRVRPERWLAAAGEPVRLLAGLQDREFRPVSGGQVEADLIDATGRVIHVAFAPGGPGSYLATLADLAPGRYRVRARATQGGRELGRSETEFAVDRWSLEEARAEPDSAALAAVAAAGGGRIGEARDASRWARRFEPRALARVRSESLRLWESPWLFGFVVGALSLEWAWRRRRGLP